MTKSQDENLNILRKKRAFKRNEKAFFINFKGLSLKQIKQIFLEGESPTLKMFVIDLMIILNLLLLEKFYCIGAMHQLKMFYKEFLLHIKKELLSEK